MKLFTTLASRKFLRIGTRWQGRLHLAILCKKISWDLNFDYGWSIPLGLPSGKHEDDCNRPCSLEAIDPTRRYQEPRQLQLDSRCGKEQLVDLVHKLVSPYQDYGPCRHCFEIQWARIRPGKIGRSMIGRHRTNAPFSRAFRMVRTSRIMAFNVAAGNCSRSLLSTTVVLVSVKQIWTPSWAVANGSMKSPKSAIAWDYGWGCSSEWAHGITIPIESSDRGYSLRPEQIPFRIGEWKFGRYQVFNIEK